MRMLPVILSIILLASAFLAGCSSTPEKASWAVDGSGRLSAVCPAATVAEEILEENVTCTESRLTLHSNEGGDTIAYLAAPEHPIGAVVYVPGAGERVSGHEDRMRRFTGDGYAFLYMDIRGNYGETPGLPFGQQLIQEDYRKFKTGDWPQYYLTICDLSSARKYLEERFHVPVYVIGSSNGGRYAAAAASVDTEFAGYVGVSTSDWGILDAFTSQGYTGDPIRFAASLEPSTYIAGISPRPVWIFHAKADPIIPYENGEDLFARAVQPKTFIPFNGSHGIDPEVDDRILSAWAQIYATRG